MTDRVENLPGMVGLHPSMLHLYRMVRQIAATDLPTLIIGETGTGKELVARALHSLSGRGGGPLIDLNCAALPETLAEGELFGWERGAFTGADRRRVGLLELADGGTVFLDELCSMPLPIQAKLLRAIEHQEFRRVGGDRIVRSSFRVIAAMSVSTNRGIAEGRIRSDLAYRLCGMEIVVPPLRERRSDILPLTQRFLERVGAPTHRIEFEAARTLREHHWPGNVRELRTVVERLNALIPHGPILAADVWVQLADTARPPHSSVPGLASLLAAHGWNVSAVARALGVARSTLYLRLQALGIARPNGAGETCPSDMDRVSDRTACRRTLTP